MRLLKATLVVPAYNESTRIEACVREAAAWVRSRPGGYDWEVILVDDGSTDGTAARAKDLASREGLDLRSHVLRPQPGQGRGHPGGRPRVFGGSGADLRHRPLDALSRVDQARRAAPDASRGHRLARPPGRPRAQAPGLPPRAARQGRQQAHPAPRRPRDPGHAVRLQALPRRRGEGSVPGRPRRPVRLGRRDPLPRAPPRPRHRRGSGPLVQLAGIQGPRRARRDPDALGRDADPLAAPGGRRRLLADLHASCDISSRTGGAV